MINIKQLELTGLLMAVDLFNMHVQGTLWEQPYNFATKISSDRKIKIAFVDLWTDNLTRDDYDFERYHESDQYMEFLKVHEEYDKILAVCGEIAPIWMHVCDILSESDKIFLVHGEVVDKKYMDLYGKKPYTKNKFFKPFITTSGVDYHYASAPVFYGNKPFLFDCLLGAPKIHRTLAYHDIRSDAALSKKTILTYRGAAVHMPLTNEKDFVSDSFMPYCGEKINYLEDKLRSVGKTIELDSDPFIESRKFDHLENHPIATLDNFDSCSTTDEGHIISNIPPIRMYAESHYSIISETIPQGCFFPTEKTGKALCYKRPFILYSTVNSLLQLRKLGFETFHDVIDESYDKILWPDKRFKAVFQAIKDLSTESPRSVIVRLKDKLEHNTDRFIRFQQETVSKLNQRITDFLDQP